MKPLGLGDDLVVLGSGRQERHPRMTLGVVPDHVAQLELAGERGVEVVDQEADDEERRVHSKPLQLVEQQRRVRTRAVVERQRDLAALESSAGDERLAREQPVDGGVLTRTQGRLRDVVGGWARSVALRTPPG